MADYTPPNRQLPPTTPPDVVMKRWWEIRFRELDLEKLMLEWLYDGFDNYEDYVKYGDAFAPLEVIDDQKL